MKLDRFKPVGIFIYIDGRLCIKKSWKGTKLKMIRFNLTTKEGRRECIKHYFQKFQKQKRNYELLGDKGNFKEFCLDSLEVFTGDCFDSTSDLFEEIETVYEECKLSDESFRDEIATELQYFSDFVSVSINDRKYMFEDSIPPKEFFFHCLEVYQDIQEDRIQSAKLPKQEN